MRPAFAVVALCALAASVTGCRPAPGTPTDQPRYAVTTSWLECCVKDVAGPDVAIVRVCPPGTCPGHFDLTPSALGEVQQSDSVFHFDFQQGLRDKLAGSCRVIKAIPAPQGLCVPERYLAGCEAVCESLCEIAPGKAGVYRASLGKVRARMTAMDTELHRAVGSAIPPNTKVLASHHQEAFCRWLGLDVVSTFVGADAVTPSGFSVLAVKGRETNVRAVIANKQEGTTVADAVARELAVPVVVFSNFPSMDAGQSTFDELVRTNMAALLSAFPGRP